MTFIEEYVSCDAVCVYYSSQGSVLLQSQFPRFRRFQSMPVTSLTAIAAAAAAAAAFYAPAPC